MNKRMTLVPFLAALAATLTAHAATYYVSPDGSDNANGESWATAKKTIQAAINASAPGDTLTVTNGTYAPIVTDNKAITIQSVNGAAVTIIDGGDTDRCATLGASGWDSWGQGTDTILTGFTLTNGVELYGGGAFCGTLNNCTITGNTALYDGGGVCKSTLNNCTITGNTANHGGGSFNSTLNNCTITGNTAFYSGGGSYDGTLNNCMITSNMADGGGGAYFGILSNCILTGNTADNDGGGVYGYGSILNNCTLSGNSAGNVGGGAYYVSLNNCIVWGNTAVSDPNHYDCTFAYSCTLPLPDNDDGTNTDLAPLFTDAANGDYRLGDGSPCIDTGNDALIGGLTDLDGKPRLLGEATDMGAYEFGTPPAQMHNQLYVDALRPDNSGDGTTWGTAKRTIQAAIVIAADGATITVADGTYVPIMTANKPITIQSVNGAATTIIDGGGTIRCATLGTDLPHTNTVLTGFTLMNGYVGNARGGGVCGGTLNHCTLTANSTFNVGGGAHGTVLNNCTLTANTANNNGGGAYESTLNGCTLSGNSAYYNGGGAGGGTLNNCIAWGNTAVSDPNHYDCTFAYSCTSPLPDDDDGTNTDLNPLFTDAANGNYRLGAGSPCIDTGNDALIGGLTDLDGKPRLLGEATDMGAYEFGTPPAQMQNQLYVDGASPDNSGGGTTLLTAKRTIQAAIVIAADGATITVADGTYAPIMTANKPITIQSANGAGAAIIDGGGTTRCATLGTGWPHTNTVLTGFTLTNGYIYGSGGGAYGGTLNNCMLTNNTATSCGGGAFDSTLNNCTLTRNTADGDGGGTCWGTLTGCTLTGNEAWQDGGGAYGGELTGCTLTGNTAGYSGGGAFDSTLNNCTLTGNTADGDGGGTCWGTLTGCTLTGNEAWQDGGGAYGGELTGCTLTDNISSATAAAAPLTAPSTTVP